MNKIQKFLLVLILLLACTLRFYKLAEVPPGLSGDEVAIGYNAYSILRTGRDEHGVSFPVYFKSFGDYKLPGYIYTTSLSIAVFGKNEFAVRFPSALAGILTVVVLFFLIKDLTGLEKKKKESPSSFWTAITSSLLLAMSPWHLQFSRAGFEANFALFLYVLGVWLTVLAVKNKRITFLWLGLIPLTLTLYSYHSFRIITPITLIGLWFTLLKNQKKLRKTFFISILALFLLSYPVLLPFSGEGGVARINQTAAFDEYKTPTMLSKMYTYPLVVLRNYLSHFSFEFLFIKGDGFGRHQIPDFGLLYRWTLPFLLIGIFTFALQKKSYFKSLILLLIFVAPLAASFARPTPHTLRSLPLIVPTSILTALGITIVLRMLKDSQKLLFALFFVFVVLYEFLSYFHLYYGHYPKTKQLDWGGAYKEIVLKASEYKKRYDIIVVDSSQFSFAPIYFKFYDDSLTPVYVDTKWVKPSDWHDKKVLFIHPDYGRPDEKNLEKIYIPNNPDKDIFIQFWEI